MKHRDKTASMQRDTENGYQAERKAEKDRQEDTH